MNILKSLAGSILFYIFFIVNSTGLSSCKKETIYDTTYIVKTDTTVINHTDTLLVKDSVYNITDGLVAYYNFNGGTLKDSSGYGNNIVFNNATATSDRLGRANNAYLFNGSSTYMYANNTSSLNPNNTITLMAIVKINGFYPGACNVNQIFGKGLDNSFGEYYLRFSDYATNSCTIAGNMANETFSAAYASQIGLGSVDTPIVKTGVWYNLVFTYDGFTGKFYIDGKLKKTWTGFSNLKANTSNLFIGAHEDLALHPYWFNGVIDEIRIYNRDLPYGAIARLVQLQE